MPGKILKRTSFGLLRTNPKLSTNIKIVADSKNRIYLESIDANPFLSKSIYKGFEISGNGSYSFDVSRFYNQGSKLLPSKIAYSIFEEDDSTTVKDQYNKQFDFTYGNGMYPKNSQLYPEEFSLFSPIWLEKDNIPDYFVIFKMDGPVTVNANVPAYEGLDIDTLSSLNSLVEDPQNFFSNVIQNAYIIKTFDLTNKTELGKYIRNHVNDANFPESPFYGSFEKGQNSYWQGISYDKGGFCRKSEDLYLNYTLVDKTITESEDFITDGFRRNRVICANLLNLEFLFDDPDQERYKFSRYFGLYMNEVELGKFLISKDRLYEDRFRETTQTPVPVLNTVGDSTSITDSFQYNTRGVKVYPEVDPSIWQGRLLSFSEVQNSRFGYVKDTKGNFYSIDNVYDWKSVYNEPGPTALSIVTDTEYLRVKNKSINWKNFSGFEDPFAYIPANKTDKKGRASIAFKIISAPNDGDEIRIRYTDWTNPKEIPFIDNHTIKGLSSLQPRQTNGITFSTNGTLADISIAIVEAINNIQNYVGDTTVFKAFYIGGEILVFSKIDSEAWNKLKISFFSDATIFPFSVSNQYVTEQSILTYQPSPISLSIPIPGKFLEVNFGGGNNNSGSRAIVSREDILEFRDDSDIIYVKTNKGYQTTGDYGLYLDEPVFDDNGEIIGFKNYESYYVVNLIDKSQTFEFGSSKKVALYKRAKNSNGYLSIFPIKDFDFDFHNIDYKKDADSYPEELFNWYVSAYGDGAYVQWPNFDYSSIGSTGQTAINELIGPNSAFILNGKFQSLIGYQDDLTDTVEPVVNEYDRLKENFLTQLALSSRVVPFINKWVYDNECVDVRENGYRLNADQSFGYGNFSPDFDQIERTPKFFTHEWYYLQKYPPYMTFDQKLNSFSYFDEDIKINPTSLGPTGDSLVIPILGSTGSTSTIFSLTGGTGPLSNLLSIEEDYFLSYFTRESITDDFGTYSVTYPIPREFKYTTFSEGTGSKASETLFRGIKVEILDRSEFSNINYNRESLSYVLNEKYNGYKFSAILTYGNAGTQITIIKNEKWKSVTLLIQADFNDILFQSIDALTTSNISRFIDRSLLYVVSDKWSNIGGIFEYTNKPISGLIDNWTDGGLGSLFTVNLVPDQNGNIPNLSIELTLNEDGGYNNLEITDNVNIYVFEGISEIKSNSFRCERISGLPLIGTITPNGARSLNDVIGIWGPFAGSYSVPLDFNPVYVGGGYDGYLSIIDSISFSNIQNLINLGDPEIRYLNVTTDGKVEENRFVINLVRPDYPVKSSYLQREILKKTPQDIQQTESILGYTLSALDRTSLNPIARYRGSYSPRWKNVIQFVDSLDLIWESLDFYNIQILDDLGYIRDENLGKIKNTYFNKVNVENPNIILSKGNSSDEERFIYPKLGEIAIDYADYYIFRSNWDPFYYRKYLKKDIFQPVIGTREPKEEKAFFASKSISIPDSVRLQTFPTGTATTQEISDAGSINNTDKNIVIQEKTFASKTELDISVYVTRSLQDWLITDGIGEEFYKYINPTYSFGDLILDDDIKDYIEKNIFQRYVVKEVIFWEKIWVPIRGIAPLPQINTQIDDEQKVAQGYKRSKNYKLILDESGGLNFRVIYTIPRDKRTSVAFTVILEKK